MPGIIEELPKPAQLDSVAKIDTSALPVGDLQRIGGTATQISASVQGIQGGTSLKGISLDRPPASLSADGMTQALNKPLGNLKSLDSKTVLGDVSPTSLPVALPRPEDAGLGDLNGTVGKITSAILPAPRVTPPTLPVNNPAIDLSSATDDLNRLARASADAPIRLFYGVLKVGNAFVTQITNADNLKALVIQSLGEIYGQQILNLQNRLPLYAIENSVKLFGAPGNFLQGYKLLLDEIELLTATDTDRLKKILAEARGQTVPTFHSFAEAARTIDFFKANDTTALAKALADVKDFTGTGEVFLQKFFDAIGTKAGEILTAIQPPVEAIGNMADAIQKYLNQAADAAESTAQKVSQQIQANLGKATQFLDDVQATIKDIEAKISAFAGGIRDKITPVINQAKSACTQIGAAIEQFFIQVEQLKQDLDKAVAKFSQQADQTLTDAFKKIEQEIRKLLAQITSVLNRPEIKDALAQARQGIEKFKTTVDAASLKPVFDLVITKTGDLETSIKALDPAKMGTPQKVALKVGVKVIEQVKVDEIIKPELEDAFRQIRQPLEDLIHLLESKALEVVAAVDAFNPGTVVANLVSGPFNDFIKVLDSVRPSQLLAPIKDANAKLTAIVQQLDPQILIDEVQKVYQQVADLLKNLDPAPLNRLIGDAVDIAVMQLGQIRDRDLPSILDTVKKTISLQNLLANSGLQEIAQADFWNKLRYFLGGEVLDQINNAVDQVGKTLADQASTLDFSHPLALLQDVVASIDKQVKADAVLMTKRFGELKDSIGSKADAIKQLETRRAALVVTATVFPEITGLLGELSLVPLITLSAATPPASVDAAVASVVTVLVPGADPLRQLSQSTFQNAALVIFQKQISDPVHKLVDQLKAKLAPFKVAIDKIQAILTALTTLPAKIDKDVALVLDTARDSIAKVITATIETLRAAQTALTGTLAGVYNNIQAIIGDLSPYWLLNSFAETDFNAGTPGPDGTPEGMMAVARRIASGRDNGDLPFAALLQTKLTEGQLQLLRSETTGAALQAGNRTNVLTAANALLRDSSACSRENVDAVKVVLGTQVQTLQAKTDRTVDDIKTLYRANSLLRQLNDASARLKAASSTGKDVANAVIRLNRIILEAIYPADVRLSLQSVHPLIVENIANLYPQQTVDRLDNLYASVIAKIRQLPDQLIKAPLDDEFKKVKDILNQNFDIAGVFKVLNIKLDGLDNDLAKGLDRLSIAYNHLLQTFDQRLSAVA